MTSHPQTTEKNTTETAAPGGAMSMTLPPPDARSPSPPAGFTPPVGVTFRQFVPRGAEAAAAPSALKDLARFAETYVAVLGKTAPPLDHLITALTAAAAWTTVRVDSSAWDAYCATEEGMAWQALRPLLEKLATAFDLAADSDKALVSEFPGLATLLGARRVIALKAASTKLLNKKAVAEGRQPYHGQVGKMRQRKAEKAALAATNATQGATAPVTGS